MELWEKYRDQFPVTKNLIYLNHAAVAPLSRRAAEAMQHLAQDALDFGSLHYGDWMGTYEGVRKSTARLINSKPEEIAITKNTSEGIAIVATGIEWKSGDVVVAFEEEFPANFFPWKKLESVGVQIRWLSIFDDLERISEAIQGARLLAISFVNYLNGYRVNLCEIGEICARSNCLFFVDAIQGMGVFPIDVEAAKIDALAADGHKWMLGPLAIGMVGMKLTEPTLSWLDTYLNTAMLIGGMGQVDPPHTVAGKAFAGTFALYAGLVVILVTAVMIAPVVHRVMHRFHAETKTEKE